MLSNSAAAFECGVSCIESVCQQGKKKREKKRRFFQARPGAISNLEYMRIQTQAWFSTCRRINVPVLCFIFVAQHFTVIVSACVWRSSGKVEIEGDCRICYV